MFIVPWKPFSNLISFDIMIKLSFFEPFWFYYFCLHTADDVLQIKLRGAEVVPDVQISKDNFVIKLFIPSHEGMQEIWLRCDTVRNSERWFKI